MNEFAAFAKEKAGMILSGDETTKLYLKYYDESTQQVNCAQFLKDVQSVKSKFVERNVMSKSQHSDAKETLTLPRILELLKRQLNTKLEFGHADKIRQAYVLMNGGRTSDMTRAEFKSACRSRLLLSLNDVEIDTIFGEFDNYNSGVINIKHLLSVVYKNDIDEFNASNSKSKSNVLLGDSCGNPDMELTLRKQLQKSNQNIDNQSAHMTYDQKIINLVPPSESLCTKYSVTQLERIIYDKIFERNKIGHSNMNQTITRLFSSGHVTNTKGSHLQTIQQHSNIEDSNRNEINSQHNNRTVSKEQFCYTLWKKLKINVSLQDIDAFYSKYDPSRTGSISMFDLSHAILHKHSAHTPLIEDRTKISKTDREIIVTKLRDGGGSDGRLREFFDILRQKLSDMVNHHGRSPQYILHSTSKMTTSQAIAFFKNKLGLDINTLSWTEKEFTDILCEYYVNKGLIDVRRILLEVIHVDTSLLNSKPQTAVATDIHSDVNVPHTVEDNGSSESKSDHTESVALNKTSEHDKVSADTSSSRPQSASKYNSSMNLHSAKFTPNSTIVSVNKIPTSLHNTIKSRSPQQIEQLILEKCNERLKTHAPSNTLYKLFHDPSSQNNREVTYTGMQNVLNKFDIIVSPSDFHAFFTKHAVTSSVNVNNSVINIRDFVRYLMPVYDGRDNPYLPKDTERIQKESEMAKIMQLLTGVRRNVGNLNGTAQIMTEVAAAVTEECKDESLTHSAEHDSVGTQSQSVVQTPIRPSTAPSVHRHVETHSIQTQTTDKPPICTPDRKSCSNDVVMLNGGILSMNLTPQRPSSAHNHLCNSSGVRKYKSYNALFTNNDAHALHDKDGNDKHSVEREPQPLQLLTDTLQIKSCGNIRTVAFNTANQNTTPRRPSLVKPKQVVQSSEKTSENKAEIIDLLLAARNGNDSSAGEKSSSRLHNTTIAAVERESKFHDLKIIHAGFLPTSSPQMTSSPAAALPLEGRISNDSSKRNTVIKLGGNFAVTIKSSADNAAVVTESAVSENVNDAIRSPTRPASAPSARQKQRRLKRRVKVTVGDSVITTTNKPTDPTTDNISSVSALLTSRTNTSDGGTTMCTPRSKTSTISGRESDKPRINSYSPRIPHPKHVDTGQSPQKHTVDPMHHALLHRYSHTKSGTVTSHQDYGHFHVALNNALKKRRELHNKHIEHLNRKSVDTLKMSLAGSETARNNVLKGGDITRPNTAKSSTIQ